MKIEEKTVFLRWCMLGAIGAVLMAAVTAVMAYQDGMLPAILPMYIPMVLVFGIHFVLLLAGKTRYPRRMLLFHPVTWSVLLVVIPDIAQALQAPAATWMSAMSQSSTNTAIVIWCVVALTPTTNSPKAQYCAFGLFRGSMVDLILHS